jgi:hypothetical protein
MLTTHKSLDKLTQVIVTCLVIFCFQPYLHPHAAPNPSLFVPLPAAHFLSPLAIGHSPRPFCYTASPATPIPSRTYFTVSITPRGTGSTLRTPDKLQRENQHGTTNNPTRRITQNPKRPEASPAARPAIAPVAAVAFTSRTPPPALLSPPRQPSRQRCPRRLH